MAFDLIHLEKRYHIPESEVVLGRGRDCGLMLLDIEVSRNNTRIAQDEAGAFVEDLQSANGTLLNGEPVDGPRRLEHGDVITIGDFSLRFEPTLAAVVATSGSALPARTPGAGPIEGRSTQKVRITAHTELERRLHVLCAAGDIEIGRGDIEEAEATVGPALKRLLERSYRKAVEPEAVATAARFAIKLIRADASVDWRDYVLQLHIASKTPLPEPLCVLWVGTLQSPTDSSLIDGYLAMLRGLASGGDEDASQAQQVIERLLAAID